MLENPISMSGIEPALFTKRNLLCLTLSSHDGLRPCMRKKVQCPMLFTPPPPRIPSTRVQRNDQKILEAAVQVLAGGGWGAFSLLSIANQAKLSMRPVQDRFPNRPAAAVNAWQRVVGPTLMARLEFALDHAGLLKRPEASLRSFQSAIRPFHAPDANMQAAAELLIAGLFNEELDAVIQADLGELVRGWCTPARGSLSRQRAAQRAYVLILLFGLMQMQRRPLRLRLKWGKALRALLDAFASPTQPASLPKDRPPHLGALMTVADRDQNLAALLQATLEEVALHGFFDATVANIVDRAGVSEGFLFGRYAAKVDLFLDAAERQLWRGTEAVENFQRGSRQRYGLGVAEAMAMRELQRPDVRADRMFGMEVSRVSWHQPKLRKQVVDSLQLSVEQRSEAHVLGHADHAATMMLWEAAMGIGVGVLPHLLPEAWRLPYDVVTVPLLDGIQGVS